MKILTHILIILLASATCSCGSHKSNMKQESHTEEQDSTRQAMNFGRLSARDISSFLKSSQNRKIDWKIYDTGKPKDPDTGKHPLLAEGSVDENTNVEQNTNVKEKDSTNLNANVVSTSTRKTDDKKEEAKQKDETTVPRQIGWVVWGLVALVGVGIVGRVVCKWRKK